MKKLFRAAATIAAATVAGTSCLALLTAPAQATTSPPWEVPQGSAIEPAVYPNEVGGLTLYNSSGQVITGGTISSTPIAAFVQGNTGLQPDGTKAELGGFTPVVDVAPGAWNEVQFGNSAYPDASAPGALATSTLPLYAGVNGYSLSNLTTAYPNKDTSSDGYAGLYVLRLQAYQSPYYSTTYDSADISVNSSTGAWSVVYTPLAATTTTLNATPASPQTTGTSVTLTADVTDPSAPGTVQFLDGTSDVGSPVTVNDGTASLTTTALPTGTDSLSAVFTPTTGAAFSGSTSNTVSYVVNTTSGGAITVSKTTALVGNYNDKVSGTGWTGHGDTAVTIAECATTSSRASSCDTANQVSATLGTGTKAGTIPNTLIKLAVGTIDTNGDTCGVAGSGSCYIVVVGNSGDATASAALAFTLPSFSVKKTTTVLGNYVDAVKATGVPIGDTVDVQECDSSASLPSPHCDASTQVSGMASASGAVAFSPTGVTLRVGSAYADGASGSCPFGGTCDVAFNDSANASINGDVAVAFATPTVSLHKSTAVLGNYVDSIKTTGFPIGDTVNAQECDASVSVPATLSSNCDGSTEIGGTAASNGVVLFTPNGVTLRIGAAYADSASGTCVGGGTCDVAITDANNSAITASLPVAFATPTIVVKKTTGVLGGYVDAVKATGFPIGDTVTAQQCDTSVVVPNPSASDCDAGTGTSGTTSTTGVVTFAPTGVTLAEGGAYSDANAGICLPGGTCELVVADSSNPGIGLEQGVTFASPAATLHVTTNVAPGSVDKVAASGFPIGDTVTATECDNDVVPANVGTNCDSSTTITGTVSSTGVVVFTSTGVTMQGTSTYTDGAAGTPGDVVVNDTTHSGFYIAIGFTPAG